MELASNQHRFDSASFQGSSKSQKDQVDTKAQGQGMMGWLNAIDIDLGHIVDESWREILILVCT